MLPVDGDDIDITQADTGKWYAYVASMTAATAARDAGGDYPADDVQALADFLADQPTPSGLTGNDPLQLQLRSFDDDSDIDIVLGDETITLHYEDEDDLDDLVTLSVDRTGVPADDAQVHVTISDFRLNLDPTGADTWTMRADDTNTAAHADAVPDGAEDWIDALGGDAGKLIVTDDDNIVAITYDTADSPVDWIILTETGANTGVFESQQGDISKIKVNGNENRDFTIDYADASVQVFIESFDSTLEAISDGTWNSGNTITVRLSDENLDTNTLTDQNMKIEHKNLPVLMIGTPITLTENLDSSGTYDDDSNATTPNVPSGTITVNSNTYVGALAIPDIDNSTDVKFTLDLTEDQVDQIDDTA